MSSFCPRFAKGSLCAFLGLLVGCTPPALDRFSNETLLGKGYFLDLSFGDQGRLSFPFEKASLRDVSSSSNGFLETLSVGDVNRKNLFLRALWSSQGLRDESGTKAPVALSEGDMGIPEDSAVLMAERLISGPLAPSSSDSGLWAYVARFDSDGGLSRPWGNFGDHARFWVSSGSHYRTLRLLSDGEFVYVIGVVKSISDSGERVCLAKLTVSDGRPDFSFGTHGVQCLSVRPREKVLDAALLSDRSLLILSETLGEAGLSEGLRKQKILTLDGRPALSFATGERLQGAASSLTEALLPGARLLSAPGRFYVLGGVQAGATTNAAPQPKPLLECYVNEGSSCVGWGEEGRLPFGEDVSPVGSRVDAALMLEDGSLWAVGVWRAGDSGTTVGVASSKGLSWIRIPNPTSKDLSGEPVEAGRITFSTQLSDIRSVVPQADKLLVVTDKNIFRLFKR